MEEEIDRKGHVGVEINEVYHADQKAGQESTFPCFGVLQEIDEKGDKPDPGQVALVKRRKTEDQEQGRQNKEP